jgi:hypothetical protein
MVLVSCRSSITATTNNPSITFTPLGKLDDSPLQTTQHLSTAVILSTYTPTVTFTPTPQPLIVETPSPTPSLLTVEPDTIIFDLYQNNRDCLFPCFWGFVLGQTDWKTAKQFLETFAYQIYPERSEGESFIAEVYLLLPQVSSAPISHLYSVQNGIITAVEATLLPVTSTIIPTVLNTYGQPNEIWLLTANSSMDGFLGFRLTLFYAQQHFMLTYGGQGEVVDGKVRGCFSGDEWLRLMAWSPEEELTFAEAADGLHEPRPVIYDLPLEEATGMSTDEFHETFKNSTGPICLETPTELWPGP